MSLILVLWLSFQTSVKPGEQKVAFIPYLQASQAAIARDLLAAAERMPAEHYGFKPTPMPAARTFAAVIGHAADGMFDACARIRGLENPAPGREKALIAKAEIVRALRASIEFCDAAFSGMTEGCGICGRARPQRRDVRD